MQSDRLGLTPIAGVARRDERFVATSTEPWLTITGLDASRLAGRWVEIVYRASLWDEPARPVFRFVDADGSAVDRIGAGPIVGAGVWSGRVPAGTLSIAVSPTNRLGRFDFTIERIMPRWWPAVVIAAFGRQRKPARSALLTKLIGWHPESDVNLAWATGSTMLEDFAAWARDRRRAVDLDGIDKPRIDAAARPPIALFVTPGDVQAAARTRASLDAQILATWRLAPTSDGHNDTLSGVVTAGDTLPPCALAYLAEQAARHPDVRLFYGDRLVDGVPDLRPGWSAKLARTRSCFDGAVFVRGLGTWPSEAREAFVATGALPRAFLDGLKPHDVLPLRRIMLETSRRPAAPPATHDPRPSTVSAAIVIPTRDHPDLLRRLLASIAAKAGDMAARTRIVIVDNGSVGAETKAFYATLGDDPAIEVLDHPGPFNFSAMCNAAAARAQGDVLVFLNDDMEVLSEGWLDRLVAHAMDPAIGAVGAKLTYPDGRIQHVGVLVGMGESAGHFGALAQGDDPGWAGRNQTIHEVSAVTGACLAVARAKFDAVGGFDAVDLPIELSDIDLCLKLGACGWQAIVDPAVHLMHEESASRGGATLRRLDVYGGQRKVFIERWRHVLRDDPVFHPGLSLYRWQAALG